MQTISVKADLSCHKFLRTSSFSSVSRFKAAMRASLVSPSKPDTKLDFEEDGLLFIPFTATPTFGDTAERAVAPRAMEFAVGEACDEEMRLDGVARELVAVAIVVEVTKRERKLNQATVSWPLKFVGV